MSGNYRVAFITGGSSGIGAALARRLAAERVRVGLIALPDERLEAEAEAIRARGCQAAAVAADVSDAAAMRAALGQLTEALGPVDLLILNAGIALPTQAAGFVAENLERMARVNVLGPAYAIESVLPQMRARRSGHIVGVSSLASCRGQPLVSGYCATKAALALLLEGLRVELRGEGIAVTTVRPGMVRTPMTEGIRGPRWVLEPDDAARIILRGVAARRPEVDFPWQPAVLSRIARAIPCAIYDRLAAAVMKNKIVGLESTPAPVPATEPDLAAVAD